MAKSKEDAGLTAPRDDMDDDAAEGVREAGKVVRYTGTADVREITETDFRRVLDSAERDGVTSVRWSAANGYVVAKEELNFLSDAEFDRLIGADRAFTIEDAPAPEPEVAPEA